MLETLIENVKNPGSTHATNFVDKLNYQLTVLAFFFLALLSTLNSYVGDPIDCWTPEYFTCKFRFLLNFFSSILQTFENSLGIKVR